MKKFIILFFLIYSTVCFAQHYKHIGVENGLSSRRVYAIQKDRNGFMWFLTHEGIDRYDGKEFKHYTLSLEGKEISSLQDLNWLYIGKKGGLWQIGRKGRIFKYSQRYDNFEMVYQIPSSDSNNPTPVTYSFIDNLNHIWLCGDEIIYKFDPESQNTTRIPNELKNSITYAIQHDADHFFVSTEDGIQYMELSGDKLSVIPFEDIDSLKLQINELYLDQSSNQLFIGTFQRGVYVFDLTSKDYKKLQVSISDITVTRIKPLNDKELLIATDGAGVYKVDINTHESMPYIVADYSENNMMNGNNINDIFIDSTGRIWMANYPIGITVRDDRYSHYQWIKHSIGNTQSLINDRVNAIIEDHEGDLWFATSNGISLYQSKTEQWKSYLSSFNESSAKHSHAYLSICEASPGIIYVGGYSSTIYKIDKKAQTTSILALDTYNNPPKQPDKYIQSIHRDSQGYIWMGGHYNLKRIDEAKKEIQLYPNLNSITTILEKDKDNMWIGTSKGLFLLNKTTGEAKRIITPIESTYIYSLCQTRDNKLYIGTNGSGLLVYNLDNEGFFHFYKNNSALLSNNIYTILTDQEDNIIFSSESGLTRFYPRDNDFHNWTKEQGLQTNHFNPGSGTLRSNGKFIFGSSDGAVEFSREMQLPRDYQSRMFLSEFKLFYESVYPKEPNSPLKKDINETEVLKLNSNQNIFSLKVSSINYDYPSNTLYSWKLEGFYDTWSRPGRENVIRFTNLGPGDYTLHIRAISNENRQIIEERSMKIIVAQPFWRSTWAFFIYLAFIGLTLAAGTRLIYMRKQRKVTNDKFQFFINTAHDIRTPLTLIKAPLEEIQGKEHLSESGLRNMNTAIRNVNVLLRLTTNLINFERMDLYSSDLYIAEYELNAFMEEIIQSFRSFAEVKKIKLTYDSNFSYLNVWFDKEKMESVFKNIISNALKYTNEGGSVRVEVSESNNSWEVAVIDTGIGIPANEQKKIFKSHFRASNAINSKVTGSGLGMVLVGKQVEFHKGKISLTSIERKGTTIRVTFPKGYDHYKKAHMDFSSPKPTIAPKVSEDTATATFDSIANRKKPKNGQRVLVVEDNDELRNYLQETLSEEYTVQTCENGKEALIIVKEYMPDLIISDIMMPEMRGDELCEILKNNIETSHIPIILLTALNDEKHVIKGLRTGADEYIIKPFNISILKATIANILTNRAMLRNRYANLEIEETEEEACSNCSTNIDWKFIGELKAYVEDNLENPDFNIDLLASDMNMSRTSLYNKIKALTDLSPSDYVRNIRLTKAAELLKEGELNVTEVAEKTGFNDAKYFREVFKKQYKVSPSKYKG